MKNSANSDYLFLTDEDMSGTYKIVPPRNTNLDYISFLIVRSRLILTRNIDKFDKYRPIFRSNINHTVIIR